MPIESVDNLIAEQMAGKPLDPLPEQPKVENVPHETSQIPEESTLEVKSAQTEQKAEAKAETNEYGDKEEAKEPQIDQKSTTDDEYGLQEETSKTYSKAEMDAYANKLVRERLARLERNHPQQTPPQQVQHQAQQASQGFQYDENSNLDWQQQLEQFVFQAADKREQMRANQIQQAIEQQRMVEFESRFKQGMDKFADYHEVVSGKNISDHMVMGARGIKDPASFFYAAAKRAPEELAKIANEPDPYAQAAAIGRLDEKLRKQAAKVSNAPKPVSPTRADSVLPEEKPGRRTNELDDLLIQNDKNRLTLLNSRRR